MAATPTFAEVVDKMVEDMKRAMAEHVRVEYAVQTTVRDEVYIDPVETEELGSEIVARYHPSWEAKLVKRTVITSPWAPADE